MARWYRDNWQEAEDEYTSFEGTEVAVRKVRVWLGAPHYRYVNKLCRVVDLGKPKKVDPSSTTYVSPFLSEGKVRKMTNGDIVEEFLRENGPHNIFDMHQAIDMPRSSLDYACKKNKNLVKTEDGKWMVA